MLKLILNQKISLLFLIITLSLSIYSSEENPNHSNIKYINSPNNQESTKYFSQKELIDNNFYLVYYNELNGNKFIIIMNEPININSNSLTKIDFFEIKKEKVYYNGITHSYYIEKNKLKEILNDKETTSEIITKEKNTFNKINTGCKKLDITKNPSSHDNKNNYNDIELPKRVIDKNKKIRKIVDKIKTFKPFKNDKSINNKRNRKSTDSKAENNPKTIYNSNSSEHIYESIDDYYEIPNNEKYNKSNNKQIKI